MSVVIVVGAQWGDEGKGKLIDLFSADANLIVRYAGGANAGHTIAVNRQKIVLHLVPSGILHPDTSCFIAPGTVVDLEALITEIKHLLTLGIHLQGRLFLSVGAHVVLPHHKLIDTLRENNSKKAIGTTKRGIGPAYEDKVKRKGLRISDIEQPDLKYKLQENIESWKHFFHGYGENIPNLEKIFTSLNRWNAKLKPFLCNSLEPIQSAITQKKKILLEGAQGTLLDIDHGTYPFVTSSHSIAGGACTGAGIGPTYIDKVIGIVKAYSTRVGNGPFPTEIKGHIGYILQRAGNEFGATTGRSRRCGWIDIPTIKHAIQVNGIEQIALTKLDVLSALDEIKICTHYRYNDRSKDHHFLPFGNYENLTPVFESMPGWHVPLHTCKHEKDLPFQARAYLDRLRELTQCPIQTVSVGPDRNQVLGICSAFH